MKQAELFFSFYWLIFVSFNSIFDRIQSNIIPCWKRSTSSGGFSSDSDASNQNMYEVAQKSLNINKREVYTDSEALPPYNPTPCPFGAIGDPVKPKQPSRFLGMGNTNFPTPSYLQKKETFFPPNYYQQQEDFNLIPISYQKTYNDPMLFQLQDDAYDYPMSFTEENFNIPLPIGYEKQKNLHPIFGLQQKVSSANQMFEEDYMKAVKDKHKTDLLISIDKEIFFPRPNGYEKQKQKSTQVPRIELQQEFSSLDESFEQEMLKVFDKIINEPAADFNSKPWKDLMGKKGAKWMGTFISCVTVD